MNEVRSLNAELLGQSKHGTFGDLKRGQYGENVKSQHGARRGWEGKQEARSGSQSGMIARRTFHIMVYINGTPGAQLDCEWRPLGCVMQPTWDRGWRRGKSTRLLPDPRKWGREIFVAREISWLLRTSFPYPSFFAVDSFIHSECTHNQQLLLPGNINTCNLL